MFRPVRLPAFRGGRSCRDRRDERPRNRPAKRLRTRLRTRLGSETGPVYRSGLRRRMALRAYLQLRSEPSARLRRCFSFVGLARAVAHDRNPNRACRPAPFDRTTRCAQRWGNLMRPTLRPLCRPACRGLLCLQAATAHHLAFRIVRNKKRFPQAHAATNTVRSMLRGKRSMRINVKS